MTKAKRILPILVTFGILSLALGNNSTSDHHAHHQQQPAASLPPLLADGATNPSAVPDLIAFEILLNSISAGSNNSEAERSRAQKFAEKTTLSLEKIELLKSTAGNFKNSIRNLDARVMEIKDRNWPKPQSNVLSELSELQKQKEEVLSSVFDSLLAQLSNEEQEKLNNRLLEIKKKVKVYQEAPIEMYQKR